MLRVEQGILQRYTGPRTCNVMQMPEHYLMTDVRLPYTLFNQLKPLPGSIVLVVALDDYRSFLLTVLRDPKDFLELGNGIRGSTTEDESFLQAGEIFLEAAGTGNPSAGFSGTGGTLYLGNDGTVTLKSGKQKEFLTLGGEDTDDDGEVILTGDNGFFESNVNHLTQTRSAYRFDEENNLELGNYLVTIPSTGITDDILEVPIAELTMSGLGEIILQNTTLGVPKCVLELDTSGTITLKNLLTTEEFSATGAYSLITPATATTMSVAGDIKLSNTVGGALHIDPTGKVALGSTTAELLDLFDQTLSAIQALTVGTGVGPSSPPLNSAVFAQIQTLLATIKGSL